MRVLLSVLMACFLMVSFALDAREKKKTYSIKWKERGNRIVHASVCFNYKYGSIDSRECRSAALAHFKQQCSDLTTKSSAYGHPHNKSIRRERDKFCVAKNSFSPIQ